MFFSVFGAIWLILWSQRAFGLRPGILAVIVFAGAAIFAAALRLYRQNQSALAAEEDSPANKKADRTFYIVNITQWVAVPVVAIVLANIGLKDWILASVILIVGIHFFPLARAFHNPQLNATGVAMVVVAVGYPLIAPTGAASPVGCLAAGIVLWASAMRSLFSNPVQRDAS